jgi:hypothetical protein
MPEEEEKRTKKKKAMSMLSQKDHHGTYCILGQRQEFGQGCRVWPLICFAL